METEAARGLSEETNKACEWRVAVAETFPRLTLSSFECSKSNLPHPAVPPSHPTVQQLTVQHRVCH